MAQLGETGGGGNFGRYSNSAFDDLVRRARRESDNEKRAGLYREADTLLVQDAALVPIYWYGQDILLRPDVKGLRSSPLGAFGIPWEEMSLER